MSAAETPHQAPSEPNSEEISLRKRRALLPILYAVFFLSGATGLVYQIVWVRKLTLVFGATHLAISTVIAAFMGGLALGSAISSRFVDKRGDLLSMYGWLEVGIGAYALAFPLMLMVAEPTYRLFWRTVEPGPVLMHLFQGALMMSLLALPTTAMGATLPLLSRYCTTAVSEASQKVGGLYTINTIGAVVGTFSCGFLMLPTMGVRGTAVTAAVINIALGLVSVWLGRDDPTDPAPVRDVTEREELLDESVTALEEEEANAADPGRALRVSRALMVAFAVSGLSAMIFEVAWSRVLSLILGSSTYAFTLILMAFLIGLAGGSAVASWILSRNRRIRPLRGATIALAMVGLTAYGTTWFFGELPYLFVRLYDLIDTHDTLLWVVKLGIACMVMTTSTFFMGLVFPLVVRTVVKEAPDLGKKVGRLYTWNTLGSIFGSLGAGFLLVPQLGILNTLLLAITLELVAAAYLVWQWRLPLVRRAGAVAVMALLGVTVWAQRPPWNPLVMSAGMYKYVDQLSEWTREGVLNFAISDYELLMYKEGVTSTVTVARSTLSGNVWLANNGKVDASTTADLPTQILLGHLPFHFAHREPERLLMVGLASGISAGAVLPYEFEQLDILEIEPAVIEASHFFDDFNGRPLEDPRVAVIPNDARNHLFLTYDPYDVVISEPSNPWITGVSNLFTEEFWQLGKSRLADDGIFCQWLQMYAMDSEDLRSLLATFRSVFPHVLVFSSIEDADLLLLGSNEPLDLNLELSQSLLQREAVSADLARLGIKDVYDLWTYVLMDELDLQRLTAGASLNTDNNVRIEFNAPRNLHYLTQESNMTLLLEHAQGPWEELKTQYQGTDLCVQASRMGQAYEGRGQLDRAVRSYLTALQGCPRDPEVSARVLALRTQIEAESRGKED